MSILLHITDDLAGIFKLYLEMLDLFLDFGSLGYSRDPPSPSVDKHELSANIPPPFFLVQVVVECPHMAYLKKMSNFYSCKGFLWHC